MGENRLVSPVVPGKSLGWITLGSSLHSVVSKVKGQPHVYPQIELSYSKSAPLLQPVILSLPSNGLRLRFDGEDQRLRLIEVLAFSRTTITYKNIELVRRMKPSEDGFDSQALSQGPTFRHVYNRLFGPAYEGEYIPPELGHAAGSYVLSYPGLAFVFPVKHKSWSDKADFVSILSSSSTSPATAMSIFSGSSWPEARLFLYSQPPSLPRSTALASKSSETVPDEVEVAKLYGAGRIEFVRRSSPITTVLLSETTPQDLIAEFGPPDAIYRKHDSRISIHAAAKSSNRRRPSESPAFDPQDIEADQPSTQSYTEDSDGDIPSLSEEKHNEINAECFYNYFNHGFDALISFATTKSPPFPGEAPNMTPDSSSAQQVVTKLILHANVPGSYSFNRHRRSRWQILLSGGNIAPKLNSEMPFSEVSATLKKIWHGAYDHEDEERKLQRGMVLNRGWGESPGSSTELLGGFEESTNPQRSAEGGIVDGAPSINNTELFGFPGLLFEVLKNDTISCVTVY